MAPELTMRRTRSGRAVDALQDIDCGPDPRIDLVVGGVTCSQRHSHLEVTHGAPEELLSGHLGVRHLDLLLLRGDPIAGVISGR